MRQGINSGRIAVVTGAGNGIGRQHALALAASGAAVVVNDRGGSRDGSGTGSAAAEAVVAEIVANGGNAVVNTDDVSSHAGAGGLIAQAFDHFGNLHILVNNAGILRDRMVANMSEEDWDAVVAVHLKGTFGTLQHASSRWRAQSKAGVEVAASVINTTSGSGLIGNVGQANYGAAKAGIAALTIISAMELERYGVRINAISPVALTRMTEDQAAFSSLQDDNGALPPEAISPIVVYLASTLSAPITGRIFRTLGGQITVMQGWTQGASATVEGIWDPEALAEVVPGLVQASTG